MATTIEEIKNFLPYVPCMYAQEIWKPDFFKVAEEHDYGITVKATMGESRFNEWYLFENRAKAIDYIRLVFNSQSFIDNFIVFGNEIYRLDEVHVYLDSNDEEYIEIPDGVEPASLQDMVEAESRF